MLPREMKTCFFDKDVALVEEEILYKFNTFFGSEACGSLLSLRKEMLNERVLKYQEILLPDIVAFNDALTDALRNMYDRVQRIYCGIKDNNDYGPDLYISGKCFLSSKYPKLHPVQSRDRNRMWEILLDNEWNPMYADGITLPILTIPEGKASFESFIGMDVPYGNWNEGLDRELTKDLHLTSAFHNLFEHMSFAITDFIYVRKFETEISIVVNRTV